jgi:16S rRNA (cytidine1402-2'-O)-methyltransferase
MPLKRPSNNSDLANIRGKLFIVATPIGNKDDITLRALDTLKKVDLVAAEDTRKSSRLLAQHKIKIKPLSYHDHNETERTKILIKKLKAGMSVALLSNAGTPTVSDPGYSLIREAIAGGIAVIPIPGVSASAAALSVAGLPTDSFIFLGFLSKKGGKRLQQLKALASEPRTIIIYESPRRILKLMVEIQEVMGNRYAVLCREMTKIHEEYLRGTLSEILSEMHRRTGVKGECTLLVTGAEKDRRVPPEKVAAEIKNGLAAKRVSITRLSKEIARKYGFKKNEIYKEALRIKAEEENRQR